ncbi:hypothetical protein GCM10027267_24450 [Paramicrobacterium agarici]
MAWERNDKGRAAIGGSHEVVETKRAIYARHLTLRPICSNDGHTKCREDTSSFGANRSKPHN